MEMAEEFRDLWLQARSRRYVVELSVEFRQIAGGRWLKGSTENMGTTGVLFRTTDVVEPNTPIEMVFQLPAEASCKLVCTGIVLRVENRDERNSFRAIAATIEEYSFVRASIAQG
jgi:hypothetical protein